MDDRMVLVERDTGLKVGWYFWLRLLDEVNRSARYGGPFAVVVLDVTATTIRDATAALSLLSPVIRGTDLAGRTGAQQAAVLLVEQDEAAAIRAIERIQSELAAHSPDGVAWRPTSYCYPRDAAAIGHLLAAPAAATGQRTA